jgi:hypothetical protein
MSHPSVYDDVKHLMIPLREIAPEQQAWIAHVTKLVSDFTHEVDDDDDDSHTANSFAIHTAAELLWTGDGGRPDWGRLDVDEYMARHAAAPTWCEEWQTCLVATLMAFYTYLAKHGHARRAHAARVLRRLERYATPALRDARRRAGAN